MKPLVSCIMPTLPGREKFRAEAVACFEAQTWPNRELVVVTDDGLVGEKRNLAASRSRGEFICHWDDDDVSEPGRIEAQMELLLRTGAELVGFHRMEFFDEYGGRWLYVGRAHYILGTSMLYPKDTWRSRPFRHDLKWGEDNEFQLGRRMAWMSGEGLMRARIHPDNTSEKAGKVTLREYRRLA